MYWISNNSEVRELRNVDLPGRDWVLVPERIRREFRFSSYEKAREFATRIAELAQKEGHHPDITLSYGRVTVELTTHDEMSVTEKDTGMARKIEELFRNMQQ
ncbi:4a-hydroxytetrahydrobiopterin dehydratase [Thermogymnomonas acidicola]|uniref:4a-hydroxytetrahydrobiopterin dehydratase n=1 Tax=Thermogymnomonas acidicola TaxID=399579 RepID=UPI001396A937|nr:4a-hydroxytetrahydrobiopterin dehydratase [Thermogymnomonas acidicola]